MNGKLRVIDASVAVKWFVRADVGRESALALLAEIEKDPRNFAVPELFFNEMLAALCRLVTQAETVKQQIRNLENIGFHRVGNGHELLARAAEIAIQTGLTGYDSVYAATAELLHGQWITFDQKAHQKLEKAGMKGLSSLP